jgi:ABC-type spermidine/putrescine transport system permease subunit I
LFHRGTVLLGMTAVLLPLMVLTIYSSVSRLDPGLMRAALACGAGPIAVFWRVLMPLTLPGIGAGFLLVFVAAIGFFITPTLLGGPGDQMFANYAAGGFGDLRRLPAGAGRGAVDDYADGGRSGRAHSRSRIHLGADAS